MNSMRNQLPQELVRGVSYDDIVMDRLGNVSNQLYEIHDHMAVGMREIIQHMDITMRKKRRSLWSQELVCLGDGSLVVSNQYDDGSREEENFITNIRGLQIATFCGQQGRIPRTVRAILSGQF